MKCITMGAKLGKISFIVQILQDSYRNVYGDIIIWFPYSFEGFGFVVHSQKFSADKYFSWDKMSSSFTLAQLLGKPRRRKTIMLKLHFENFLHFTSDIVWIFLYFYTRSETLNHHFFFLKLQRNFGATCALCSIVSCSALACLHTIIFLLISHM